MTITFAEEVHPKTGGRDTYPYCGIKRQDYNFTEDIEEVFYKEIASLE